MTALLSHSVRELKNITEGGMRLKRFGNTSHKINVILSVFSYGETLQGKEIADRVKQQGYRVEDTHLNMFIYHHMLHKHLQRIKVNGTNHYSLLNGF